MTDGLSAADVMALSRDDENNWMNNPFIYLVWMWMFGANGWNRNGDAAMQVNSTRAWSALSKITKRQNRHLNVCSKCGTSLKRIISKKPRTLK